MSSEITTSTTDEPLINLRPRSLYEKYIWAKSLIIDLINAGRSQLVEIGKLQSEKDELMELLKDKGLQKIPVYKDQIQAEQKKNKELAESNSRLVQRIAHMEIKLRKND